MVEQQKAALSELEILFKSDETINFDIDAVRVVINKQEVSIDEIEDMIKVELCALEQLSTTIFGINEIH